VGTVSIFVLGIKYMLGCIAMPKYEMNEYA